MSTDSHSTAADGFGKEALHTRLGILVVLLLSAAGLALGLVDMGGKLLILVRGERVIGHVVAVDVLDKGVRSLHARRDSEWMALGEEERKSLVFVSQVRVSAGAGAAAESLVEAPGRRIAPVYAITNDAGLPTEVPLVLRGGGKALFHANFGTWYIGFSLTIFGILGLVLGGILFASHKRAQVREEG